MPTDTERMRADCADCPNSGTVDGGWFVRNVRTGSVRCTKCGGYNVVVRPRKHY